MLPPKSGTFALEKFALMYRPPQLNKLATQPITPKKEQRFASLRAGMADGTIN